MSLCLFLTEIPCHSRCGWSLNDSRGSMAMSTNNRSSLEMEMSLHCINVSEKFSGGRENEQPKYKSGPGWHSRTCYLS